jgi:hypothetical protein
MTKLRHPAPRTGRLPGQVVQQHGLANARIAVHDQGPALAAPDRLDQPVERAALAEPALQRRRRPATPDLRSSGSLLAPLPGRLAAHERSHSLPAGPDPRPDKAVISR